MKSLFLFFSRLRATTLLFAVLCYGSIISLSRDCCAGTASDKTTVAVHDGADGAKLWAQTCVQCHNLRPPGTFSGAQWEVIVHHMRVRARLTKAESQAIVEFLKSGK